MVKEKLEHLSKIRISMISSVFFGGGGGGGGWGDGDSFTLQTEIPCKHRYKKNYYLITHLTVPAARVCSAWTSSGFRYG